MDIILTVCIKDNNSLLMVKEVNTKARGLWNLPSGHLEQKEDIFLGAIREAKEETGYDVELTGLLSVQNYIRNVKPILRIIYNARIISRNGSFDKCEILQSKWIPISTLENMQEELRSIESFQDILADIKRGKNYPLDIIKNIIGDVTLKP